MFDNSFFFFPRTELVGWLIVIGLFKLQSLVGVVNIGLFLQVSFSGVVTTKGFDQVLR